MLDHLFIFFRIQELKKKKNLAFQILLLTILKVSRALLQCFGLVNSYLFLVLLRKSKNCLTNQNKYVYSCHNIFTIVEVSIPYMSK